MQPVTTVSAGQAPRRLDVFVSTQTAHLSRAVVQRWIGGGLITVNGRKTKPARLIRPGDVIACHVPVRAPRAVEPEALALRVLHEDAALLVIDKPAGLVMHPGPGHWTGTLLNGLVHHVGPGEGRRARPGLVHRLDKGTSGVLVIAKTDAAHRDLSRQFHAHSVHRVYLALVAGAVRRGGLIDQGLGRDTRDRRRVSVRSAAPRRAVTEYRVAERLGPDATLPGHKRQPAGACGETTITWASSSSNLWRARTPGCHVVRRGGAVVGSMPFSSSQPRAAARTCPPRNANHALRSAG